MGASPLQVQSSNPQTVLPRASDWSAVWSGVFIFASIWTVFEVLGLAIFASASGATVATVASSMGVGMAIWTIVLTVIAMYIAGRETGRLASVATRYDGLVHGMMMFGLSVISAIVLTALASSLEAASTHGIYILNFSAATGWGTFIALLLGWLAAMAGASAGTRPLAREMKQPTQMRPAA
jgi:hypothetical protein